MIKSLCLALTVLCFTLNAQAQHRVLLQGNNRLAIIELDGTISWEMPWGGIHDLHRLESGLIVVQETMQKVAVIDPMKKAVVWHYDAAQAHPGKKVEVHAFQPLAEGLLMMAESGPGRIVEVDRNWQVRKEFNLTLDHPDPHRDTRLARKLINGSYLVCHEGDGKVREYKPDGALAWEYEVPLFGKERKEGHGPEAFGNSVFSAVRLPNGNTLIGTGNGHSLLEVNPAKEVVWSVHQNDLPGITLAWVTTLEVLPNGHIVFGNCHAGPGQPLLIEIEPKMKQVVWRLDEFERFGNDVSNSLLLDMPGKSVR